MVLLKCSVTRGVVTSESVLARLVPCQESYCASYSTRQPSYCFRLWHMDCL